VNSDSAILAMLNLCPERRLKLELDGISTRKSMEFRLNRIGKSLEIANLDALIAATPENAVYLSGAYNPIRKLLPERPAIVLCPRDGSPSLIYAGRC